MTIHERINQRAKKLEIRQTIHQRINEHAVRKFWTEFDQLHEHLEIEMSMDGSGDIDFRSFIEDNERWIARRHGFQSREGMQGFLYRTMYRADFLTRHPREITFHEATNWK